MKSLLIFLFGVLVGVIYIAWNISFEDKCDISGGIIVDGVCILDNINNQK